MPCTIKLISTGGAGKQRIMGVRKAQGTGSKRKDWVTAGSPVDSGTGICTGNTKRKKMIEKLK